MKMKNTIGLKTYFNSQYKLYYFRLRGRELSLQADLQRVSRDITILRGDVRGQAGHRESNESVIL